ncbi:MAG: acetylornithine deacetylase [Woeseiaceae bacterium]
MTNDRILEHLENLVCCDTQNPPRDIGATHDIFRYIDSVLKPGNGFSVSVEDHGRGRVSYLAKRGDPKILFNVHLDTVPIGEGWTRPPLKLTFEEERAFGRGCCDIKGAAAVLLAIAQASDYPIAILFSTDEEGAEGCCVEAFSQSLPEGSYQVVVVAEPTECKAVVAHRGYLSVLGEFHGEAGHSSAPRALIDNANHQAAVWASTAIEYAASEAALGRGLCFNLGSMSGGTGSNVIAAKSNVHWSARLPPGGDTDSALSAICNATDASRTADWNARFTGPPLPAHAGAVIATRDFCARHNLEVGAPVDYWTEASLFSAAGHPAMVLGPGNIKQAHSADEWVSVDQLIRAAKIYDRLLQEAHQ